MSSDNPSEFLKTSEKDYLIISMYAECHFWLRTIESEFEWPSGNRNHKTQCGVTGSMCIIMCM